MNDALQKLETSVLKIDGDPVITDNGDGTVTDNDTGLVWSQKDSWQIHNDWLTFQEALSWVNELNKIYVAFHRTHDPIEPSTKYNQKHQGKRQRRQHPRTFLEKP